MVIIKSQIGLSRKLLALYKQQLNHLSPTQLETAIGLCLGDASLNTQCKQKRQYRMKFEWKQEKYAFHIYEIFDDWILSPPKLVSRINPSSGGTSETWRFQTFSHPALSVLADLFLDQQGRKQVPAGLIANHLTARGLAYWYMDDGGIADQGRFATNLHTQGFKPSEVEVMCQELSEKFAITCWPKKNKQGLCIVISGHSYEVFRNTIKPWVIPSMLYKLPVRTAVKTIGKTKKE
jgi:hypothetical protein